MANSCVRDCPALPQDSAGESGHVAVMSTFILYFFNFLRQPSGELHYVCECCPSVSLPQPQQVSLAIWQMQCWGREGFCVRVLAAGWVTLTMWQTRRWRLWCTGANYVCESRGTRQAGCDHACLTNAEAQAPLCIRCADNASLWEARLTTGRVQCYRHKHQDSCLCAYTARPGAECTSNQVAAKTLKTGSTQAMLSNENRQDSVYGYTHIQMFASLDLVN